MLRKILLICALVSFAQLMPAQVATGLYSYGSFDNPGVESIDRGSLNVHFSIPVVNKSGRGLPFQYSLVYDGLVWAPAVASGLTTWTPDSSFGLHGSLLNDGYKGYLAYRTIVESCNRGSTVIAYGGYAYHDQFGAVHAFNYSNGNCEVGNVGDGSSNDGSGYKLNVSPLSVIARNGQTLAVPIYLNSSPQATSGTITDLNGNQIVSSSSGVFTDTLGTSALKITGNGNASSPKVLTYLTYGSNPNNTTPPSANVTITYKTYTVRTSFGCSGVSEYNQSVDLADRITLADGTYYQFGYETTPGYSPDVTGRLASLTLPQGGTISYQYTGGSNGINCADGTPTGITRSITGQTRTYVRSLITTTSSHTDIQDGSSTANHSTFDFVTSGTPAAFYETQESTYQGAVSGTPLLARQTCYNGATSPCTTTTITLPIGQIDTYETLNGIEEHGSTAKYNTYGLQTEQDDYDFGSTGRGALLRKEVWAYPSTGIPSLMSSDTVYDGSGNEAALTTYLYDGGTLTTTSGLPQHSGAIGSQRGNVTTVTQYASASTSLATTLSYEDTGNPLSITTPNGKLTNTYEPTTHAYATTSTPPTPSSGTALPNAATEDLNTGLALTNTDPNNAQVAYRSFDSSLRPTEVDSLDSSGNTVGKTTYSYSATQSGVQTYHNASTSADTETHYDGYGRADRVAVYNGQSGNAWYEQDSCFDGNGRLLFKTYSYASTGLGGSKVCSGAGDTYAYDALGRVTKITHADATTTNYSYNGRATQKTDENNVIRITQVDSLGRPTIVCEVTSAALPSSGSPGSCGTDISATGYSTTYAYNLATHTSTVTQGAQIRVFQTDFLGRSTSVKEPESGTTTYSYAYNNFGLAVTRTRPAANQTSSTVLTTTTTQYDAVGRPLTVSYSDGTPAKWFTYDTNGGWGFPQSYTKGRLDMIRAINGSGAWVGAATYSYDALGRVIETRQCQPSNCSNVSISKDLLYSYDWAGDLLSSTDGAGVTSTYTVSPASQITSISSSMSDGTHPSNLIANVQSGPNGPITYYYGNGLSQYQSYDSLGRNNGGWVCGNAPSNGCTNQRYGFFVNWSGSRTGSSDDDIMGQNNAYGYDPLNRLTSVSLKGGATTFSYTYDRWGNRLAQNALQGGPDPSYAFNTANNQITTMSYDAVGNVLNDGFHAYLYDAENNVIEVDSGSTAVYTYDGLNRRVRVDQASGSQEFVFNVNAQRVSIWNPATGAQVQGQYYWGSKPIAFYTAASGQLFFQHQDWLGTERTRTTYNGVVASAFSSLAFGDNYTVTGGSDADAYHFASLDQDSTSSTSHAQFRQYSSTAGRWMSPDPYYGSYRANNPQSFNRYVYAKNNPTSSFDPSGLDEMEDGDGDCDNWGCAEGGGGGGGACGPTDGSCVNTTTDPDPPVDPGPDPDPGIGIGGYQTTASPTSPTAPNNANPINPCSTANPNNLDYLTTNAQQHILQNHTPGGKGPSFYVGDWTAISLFNQATLTQGYLAPPQFQRAGTYTLQWTAPPLMFPLNLIWPGPYIGTGQTGQQTGTNRLVVKTNCSTVITSYPVTP